MIAQFLDTHPVVQFFVVFGAAQFLYSFWRRLEWQPAAKCRHTWGVPRGVRNSTRVALYHQWRACKRCGAVMQRYKLTRRGGWYFTAPIPADELLPATRVVER